MAKTAITTRISQKELSFKPGGTPATFDVLAVNESDRFATFQIELLAPGTEEIPRRRWYDVSPEVSTKKPPGDRTQFQITITDTPIPGFAGIMNLTIRIFSLELGEERKVVRLVLEPGAELPLKVELPIKHFQVSPLEQVDIPVRIHNPSQRLTAVRLTLSGIPANWLTTGMEQRFRLEPDSSHELNFTALLPAIRLAQSGRYPFTVQVTQQNGPPSSVGGVLEVLPAGYLEVDWKPLQQQLPPKHTPFWKWITNLATYTVEFTNDSNVAQIASLQIQGDDQSSCVFQILPDRPTLMPGEKLPLALSVTTRRPWWGWGQSLLFQVKALVSDPRTDLRQDHQTLRLKVSPLLPLWLQLLLALLLLYLLWAISWLNPYNPLFTHQDKVNTVQFNGVATEIVSGSDDQTLLRWRTDGFANPLANQQIGRLGRAQKAVRVMRYRPLDNDWVTAGLENGEIQLWHLSNPGEPSVFSNLKDDRVLGLTFTRDARFLFSGHGSGLVLQWDVSSTRTETHPPQVSAPVQTKQLDFAIYGMAAAGESDQTLAIAGRYNRLVLWNWKTDALRPLPYPRTGGQDDYLTSVSTAIARPYLLATSDNQGYITLWDLRACLEDSDRCQPLEEWRDGHGGKPVRSVALSQYGCYLVSAGADGRVVLWVLTPEGKRDANFLNGIVMDRSAQPFNSVDIKVVDQKVLVASGNDDHLVRLATQDRKPEARCDVLN